LLGIVAKLFAVSSRLDAEAFASRAAPSEDVDETASRALGNATNDIPASEFDRHAPRDADMPSLVPMYATEDAGNARLLREDAIRLEQCREDQANRGIERRDRGEMQPNLDVSDAVVKAEQDVSQLPISRGCRQRPAQTSQQPLMNELLPRDAREPTAARIRDRRTPKTCEGEECRFLAA
jgi:hypothetical protein